MDGGDLMTVLKTLEQSRFYELNLIVEGEQLHLAAPIEPPADLLDSLKENKQLIIKHLELYQDASLVWTLLGVRTMQKSPYPVKTSTRSPVQ